MNTLTGLIPTIYTALDVVRRELIGFTPNIAVDAAASGAAIGQTVTAHVVPQGELEDIVPGPIPANTGDQEIGTVGVKITQSKAYPVRWTGEEQLALSANGQYNAVLADQFAQGFRTLSNAVESDIAALYRQVARGIGADGATLFGTKDNHKDWANANKVLDKLGCPQSGRVMIVDSEARANIEGIQSGLFHVNEAGDAGAMLRDRQMRTIHGFTMGYSAGITSHAASAATGYLVNNAGGYAAGARVIALDGGTGTLVAGDVVTFEGDPTEYVVESLAGGDLTLNAPGLARAVADNAAVTVLGDFTANAFFHRNAFLLAARAPAMPAGGDEADDVMTVTDPVSGISFQIAMYRQYRQIKYEIGLAWGVDAPNPALAGVLRG